VQILPETCREWIVLLFALAGLWPAQAQETNCPAYPVSTRVYAEQAINLDRQFAALGKLRPAREAAAVPPSQNFIDDWIFGKLAGDGVDAAPLTTDAEFVRRIYLDLTGRIPTFEQAQSFLADTSAGKRAKLIDALLATPAFVDQFSHWFLQRFQVARGAGNIGIPTRNNFYNFVRQFVEQDRPYDAFARDLLTATGDTDVSPGIGLLSRQITEFYATAPQDFWDNFTDVSTTQFLGFQTSCVSCHNGRGHLEKINLFLTPIARRQFWQLSAFFSRTRFQAVTDDAAAYRTRIILSDALSGNYTGIVNPAAPGPRPSREGANEQPVYWFTGDTPQSGAWRSEWARILTADPQFARAGVNYIWAYFFGSGIVDPPDGWDLSRVDPANPPPGDWPLQVSHPELLKELASRFAASQFSIRAIVKLIVSSNAYQLSSRYPAGKWQPAYVRYFARHEPRRLTAEQIFDSLTTATGTEPFMEVDGLPGTFRYANQLPHPRSTLDFGVDSLLTSLGQGDWIANPPSNQPSLYGVLDFFNNWQVAARTRSWSDAGSPQSRLATWVGSGLSDTEVIRNLFLTTLTRTPTEAEVAAILAKKQADRLIWLTSVQWALLQKADFAFQL
jgi:hypothetical protein